MVKRNPKSFFVLFRLLFAMASPGNGPPQPYVEMGSFDSMNTGDGSYQVCDFDMHLTLVCIFYLKFKRF